MRSLIDILDLSVEEIDGLIRVAHDIMANREAYREKCKYKTLATLFFEPSTRTRLSFEAAMLELGGNVLGFSEANSSSASKGESVADTVSVVSGYCDIIAMRHPKEGAPLVAAKRALVPVINAGDGGHNHPTQTLTDLVTISQAKGRLDHLTVGLCGDLKFGRTVHSLIHAMSRYEGVEFVLISPEELRLPEYVKTDCKFTQTQSLEEAMPQLDCAVYDPGPAGAVFQRGRLCPPEGQLHSHTGKITGGQEGPEHPAPAAQSQRDLRGGGRRPAGALFPAG